MGTKHRMVLFFLLVISYQNSFSQIKKTEKDSAAMYTKIQTYSKKHPITKLLHRVIFRPSKVRSTKTEPIQKHLEGIDGKIIRTIKIVTLDPFGYSDKDTLQTPSKWSERAGNTLHLKTKEFAVKNALLFKKNKPYDAFEIQESERILRAQRFVNRVSITERLVGKGNDSVDVYVRVLDSWSSVPKFEITESRVAAGLNENNFLGSGHRLDYRFTNRFSDGKNANELAYTVPNFKNTFIKTRLNYQIDLDNNYSKKIEIERPFYSPLTKWAGGIALEQLFRRDTIQGLDLLYAKQNFKYSSHDFWLGKAMNISKDDTINNKTTNLVLTTGFTARNYIESPTVAYDPLHYYSNEKTILLGIGINNREFVEDQYIFKNGIIEDVPVGQIFGITTGYQYKNKDWRAYLGGQISFGNYYKWGFLSTNLELGTFFNQSKTEQTAISFQANYFTHLMRIGNWKIRQFIKPQLLVGINRMNTTADQLTINQNFGLPGFNSPIYGTNKMILTLQTQSYAPKDIGGFRINPYLNYTMAILGNSLSSTQKNKGYSKISAGVIISNDFLVFSAFQFSISYYPTIPFEGDNVFRTNAFQTTDFGFQNFELAKPKTVSFK